MQKITGLAGFRKRDKIIAASFIILFLVFIFIARFAGRGNSASAEEKLEKANGNAVCREFKDGVFWSSRYSEDEKGSVNYQTWDIQNNCIGAGGNNCSLHDISVKSRILYFSPYNTTTAEEAYAQISELQKSDCSKPQKEKYSEYLAYGIPEEEAEWKIYCGKNADLNSECGVEVPDKYDDNSMCYGIKTHAPQYSVVDVVEVKYTLCWDKDYGDNSIDQGWQSGGKKV